MISVHPEENIKELYRELKDCNKTMCHLAAKLNIFILREELKKLLVEVRSNNYDL